MANNKVKGLLKGLRYISQIFDNDQKEQEMQIGYPTDVKHVAHIGWDGPSTSVNSPNWMNEFKPSSPGFSSASSNQGDQVKDETPTQYESEDSNWRESRASKSTTRDVPDLPKSSRHRSSTETTATSTCVSSPRKSKSDKARSRKSSKNSTKDLLDQTKANQGNESPFRNLPDVPKKSRQKNSKESTVVGRSSRSSSKPKAETSELDNVSESDSVRKGNKNEHCHTSALSPLKEGEQGFAGIS